MNIHEYRYLDWRNNIQLATAGFYNNYQEQISGIATLDNHGTRISLVPWGRIVEVYYR